MSYSMQNYLVLDQAGGAPYVRYYSGDHDASFPLHILAQVNENSGLIGHVRENNPLFSGIVQQINSSGNPKLVGDENPLRTTLMSLGSGYGGQPTPINIDNPMHMKLMWGNVFNNGSSALVTENRPIPVQLMIYDTDGYGGYSPLGETHPAIPIRIDHSTRNSMKRRPSRTSQFNKFSSLTPTNVLPWNVGRRSFIITNRGPGLLYVKLGGAVNHWGTPPYSEMSTTDYTLVVKPNETYVDHTEFTGDVRFMFGSPGEALIQEFVNVE